MKLLLPGEKAGMRESVFKKLMKVGMSWFLNEL
jgi:hypothetical protein